MLEHEHLLLRHSILLFLSIDIHYETHGLRVLIPKLVHFNFLLLLGVVQARSAVWMKILG